ncbi:MAG: efflux RND transporter periplasmic adaptor subunit [Victivallales bacterium]|nr:efflux RND transporter periplasmic adaptor subunit [Victivallales bacterium]
MLLNKNFHFFIIFAVTYFSCFFSFSNEKKALYKDKQLCIAVPSKEAVVSSRVSSVVTEIFLKEGEKVGQGKTIVELDSKPFKLEKKAALNEISRLIVKKKYLNIVYNRAKKLAERKVLAQAELDNATNQKRQNEQKLEVLRSEVRILNFDISNCSIAAPFKGVISKIITHKHEYIRAGDPLFKIVNDEIIHIIINFDEEFANSFETGQSINIKFRNLKNEIKAEIIRLAPVIDPETKTFKVTAKTINGDSKIKIGMIGHYTGFAEENKRK